MFAKITHKGLNGRKQASKLHQMILSGHRNSFYKPPPKLEPQDNDEKNVQPDLAKKEFTDTVANAWNEFLSKGMNYA